MSAKATVVTLWTCPTSMRTWRWIFYRTLGARDRKVTSHMQTNGGTRTRWARAAYWRSTISSKPAPRATIAAFPTKGYQGSPLQGTATASSRVKILSPCMILKRKWLLQWHWCMIRRNLITSNSSIIWREIEKTQWMTSAKNLNSSRRVTTLNW